MLFQRPLGKRTDSNRAAPTFIRPLQDKRVVVGQRVVLECQLDGHPYPVIKWLKDGQNVTQCPDYQLHSENLHQRLIIKNAQGSDCGRFTIQAINAAGAKQSTCTLIVGPAPTPVPGALSIGGSPALPQTPVGPSVPFFIKGLNHLALKPSAPAVLEVRVVGVPSPQIEWLKNGAQINNYRIRMEFDPETGISILTIPQMFAEDLGEYTCRASNNIGAASSSAYVRLFGLFT